MNPFQPMDINSVASKITDKINTVIKNQEVKVPAHLLEAIQSMIDDRAAMEELVQVRKQNLIQILSIFS